MYNWRFFAVAANCPYFVDGAACGAGLRWGSGEFPDITGNVLTPKDTIMPVKTIWTTVAISLLLAAGCADNPADTKPAAKVEAPAPTPGPAPQAAPASDVDLSQGAHLSGDIIFVGSKVTKNHVCKFTDWAGRVVLDGDDPTRAALRFVVQTGAIAADYENPSKWSAKLEKHLRDEDFFNSEKYPTASFSSTKITKAAEGADSYEVTGDLRIKGTTKSVSFPATMSLGENQAFKSSAEFSINRRDFGIIYDGKPDDLVRDEVLLKLQFEAGGANEPH